MMIFKKALPRRTVLRGLGATLGLPLLDSMVPAVSGESRSISLVWGTHASKLKLATGCVPVSRDMWSQLWND